jgi:nucleotidyltransferase substrate binding protein (TIGR01987 family)
MDDKKHPYTPEIGCIRMFYQTYKQVSGKQSSQNSTITALTNYFTNFELNMEDIRWEQRFSNFVKAMHKLEQSVQYIENEVEEDEIEDNDEADEKYEIVLDEMIKEGLIQRFEYTHELAWNVMKDYAEYQGNTNIGGSRDATKEAFSLRLIADGEVWMDMIGSRNKTTHTYNEDTANEIYRKILKDYYPAFVQFRKTMEEKRSGKQQGIF